MTFLLSRPGGLVRAEGSRRTFGATSDALDAARNGQPIVGAFGFEPDGPAALVAPERMQVSDVPLPGRPPLDIPIAATTALPDPVVHCRRVAEAIDAIAAGKADKVVLARALELSMAEPVDPVQLAGALAGGNAEHNAFVVDLGPAGAGYVGHFLVGASPELLVAKRSGRVWARPYAGSASRHTDPELDRRSGEALAASDKDHAEHRFVVDYLGDALAPFCSTVEAPDEPILLSTGEIWHLATPIVGELRDPTISALELALALHPTPAVCGTPTAAARDLIADVEGPRGFYAGAVGWSDKTGDGEWMVAIRCAELSDGGRRVHAHAGGGIVAQSDPTAELDETTAKFGTVLRALGGV